MYAVVATGKPASKAMIITTMDMYTTMALSQGIIMIMGRDRSMLTHLE